MANLPINISQDGGGAKPFNLSREQVLSIALEDYRKNLPTPDNDGIAYQTVVNAPPKEVAYSSVNLSPEEKFYESLGLKDKGGLTLPLKSKGRLLVAVVLVAGYFAYKKFKK